MIVLKIHMRCVYVGMRYAVGLVIKIKDVTEVICTKDASWQNKIF